MSVVDRALLFAQIVAQVEPDPIRPLDRQVVNAARRIARAMQEQGLGASDQPPPLLPVTASGIPITRRKA